MLIRVRSEPAESRAACWAARLLEATGGTLSALVVGPSMKPFHSQDEWIDVTRQPVSSCSDEQLLVLLHDDQSKCESFCVVCALSTRLYVAPRASSYISQWIAKRHDVRAASEPYSAAGVPDPEQPVVPAPVTVLCAGMYQFGTRPVVAHCELPTIRYDVSISASHCGASVVPSVALVP
jgi:hypothetical protein